MDFSAADLHHAADGDRFVAPQIQDSFQNEVRVQARPSKRRRIGGLEGQRDQDARVKCAVVIGVARQDEMMGQRLTIGGLRFGHEWMGKRLQTSCAGRNRTYDLQVMSLAS